MSASVSAWSCYCGTLHRLKHRGVRCVICRVECRLVQRNPGTEMIGWMVERDYQGITSRKALQLLIGHSIDLMHQVRNA